MVLLCAVDVIFGVASPSGRLPFSYPLDNGNAQYPYHHKPEDQCVDALGNYIICEVSVVLIGDCGVSTKILVIDLFTIRFSGCSAKA